MNIRILVVLEDFSSDAVSEIEGKDDLWKRVSYFYYHWSLEGWGLYSLKSMKA